MAHLSESILPGRARPGEECERRVLRGSLSWARERSGGASWGRALRGPNPVWAPPPGAPSVPSPDPAEPRRSRPAMETRVVLWRPQLLSLLLVLLCGGCTPVVGCNETRMLEMLPRCGKAFADRMHEVDAWKWCNLSEFVVYYDSFTNCTEEESTKVGCYWPNPLAQGLIIGIHRQFFSNCTVDRPHWEDPSDEVLIPLVIVPVLLTVAMAGLVVWRSKRTDQLL
ncbi:receptor activity-modifying protein 3 isoform X1 [Equus przewalskii]|uniref:Receptor activity-modifying protein 3 n=1 Tax=Equus przewalskii TaxID=9798 RepID=A0ABM2F6K7_EQUPR|nr:receptor activity-modifying protein 3 [Equus caballus]